MVNENGPNAEVKTQDFLTVFQTMKPALIEQILRKNWRNALEIINRLAQAATSKEAENQKQEEVQDGSIRHLAEVKPPLPDADVPMSVWSRLLLCCFRALQKGEGGNGACRVTVVNRNNLSASELVPGDKLNTIPKAIDRCITKLCVKESAHDPGEM